MSFFRSRVAQLAMALGLVVVVLKGRHQMLSPVESTRPGAAAVIPDQADAAGPAAREGSAVSEMVGAPTRGQPADLTPSAATVPAPPLKARPLEGALRPPSIETLRAEATRNPHGPSASYVAWGEAFADEMAAAREDPARARVTFERLMTCLQAPAAEAVTAVCLAHARELAGLYPSWRARLEAIEKGISPRVRGLLD